MKAQLFAFTAFLVGAYGFVSILNLWHLHVALLQVLQGSYTESGLAVSHSQGMDASPRPYINGQGASNIH